MLNETTIPTETVAGVDLASVLEMAMGGGLMMIPIAICSVIALAYTVERWVRLRPNLLGTKRFGHDVVVAVQDRGVPEALELCEGRRWPMARVLAAGLRRTGEPFLDREKVVEDVASSELRALASNLRPLYLVFLVAPLLGLLGTVWGMIESFSNIALEEGIGKPEQLAAGIYQALTTTAAGLSVAIPSIVAYYWLRGQIEAFGRRMESVYREVDDAVTARA
ncbi:MAG: biopolymer transport protein ExbB [Planctomycetota bacterium]|jgi:biopolymer transport protein ExbB